MAAKLYAANLSFYDPATHSLDRQAEFGCDFFDLEQHSYPILTNFGPGCVANLSDKLAA